MPNPRPRLYLIDGYALIYRAFFAMIARPLRTARGENTSAVWGVVNFLLRLREKYKPDYLAWVHDMGTSFREERYPEYKSTRDKLDEELQADFDSALQRVTQLLAAFRIPLVGVPGYEADDVIGTLATRALPEHNVDAVIVSGDKDFYQLIGPGISLLNPGRGGPAGVDEVWVDESNGSERLGVPPSQVIDYLALVGDTSDNVPGVKGVGEKTAQKLLQEYGNLDEILAHAADISGKRPREALLANADNARLSRELVTIMRDVPVEFDLQAMAMEDADVAALIPLLTELEFYSLVKRFSAPTTPADGESSAESAKSAEVSAAAAAATVVGIITDPAELPAIVERLRAAPIVAFDTETSSLSPRDAELIGLSLAISPTEAWYLPFGHQPPPGDLAAPAPVCNLPSISDPALAGVRGLLSDPAVPKAGHNVKYDIEVMRRAGVTVRGVTYDSMLASFVIDPGRRSHAIDTLALEHLGITMRTYRELVGKGKAEIPFACVAVEIAADYCGADSTTVLALRDFFAPTLEKTGMTRVLDEIEMPLVPVIADMEWEGIRIDVPLFQQLAAELSDDLATIERDIAGIAGEDLNINSPRQLAAVLFEKEQLPVLKKTRTGPSTDADVLEQLAEMGHALPRKILDYRELQKLKSTYVDTLPASVNPVTGRIHTSFNQAGAATGRLSSTDPNLQNIPIRTPRGAAIRRGFIPREGWKFLVADYSQIELRLMAHLSKDPAFIDAFRKGGDIHRQTAAIIFGVPVEKVTSEMRARAKTINFATIYGQGPFALSRQLGITQEEAREFIRNYFLRFQGVRDFLDRQVELAREFGFVETLSGRRRYIPEVRDRNFNIRAYGERTAQNSPLQGSAADLIKLAMIEIHRVLREERLESRLLLQVHDELVLEVPPAELDRVTAIVREHMEGAASLDVPLVVEIGVGENWLEAKA
ncbi:MAG TPA: DNA polymerase I [Gemmatimonadales bacterium]|nr:DNA polymerase I [Gemmatimonadales bacterium]